MAKRLAVSPKSIRQWLREGRLKGLRAGKLWRIKVDDLEQFLHAHVVAESTGRVAVATPDYDDLDWLEADASNLDRFEPYEWEDGELDAGQPIRLEPGRGLVIGGGVDE